MIVTSGAAYVAVIPARGGSKGVPGKNVRSVAGKPLLQWTVEHTRKARTPMRVVVSTDDPGIAELAVRLGAEVPSLRPAALATDDSPTEPAVLHAVGSLPDSRKLRHVVLLQPTSPVRDDGSLDEAVSLYERSRSPSLVSVVESPPWLWSGTPELAVALYDVDHRPRRQDVPPSERRFRETGNIYVTSLKHLEATGNRLSQRPYMFVMRPHEGLDIDDEFDLEFADSWLRSASNFHRSVSTMSYESQIVIVHLENPIPESRLRTSLIVI